MGSVQGGSRFLRSRTLLPRTGQGLAGEGWLSPFAIHPPPILRIAAQSMQGPLRGGHFGGGRKPAAVLEHVAHILNGLLEQMDLPRLSI